MGGWKGADLKTGGFKLVGRLGSENCTPVTPTTDNRQKVTEKKREKERR